MSVLVKITCLNMASLLLVVEDEKEVDAQAFAIGKIGWRLDPNARLFCIRATEPCMQEPVLIYIPMEQITSWGFARVDQKDLDSMRTEHAKNQMRLGGLSGMN